MIKFFRKIRLNLLSEGNTRKYLKYAIGEILLVVIGILIALQINNWNESIKINVEEKQSLNKLHDESEAIVENLEDDLRSKDSIIMSMEQVARTFQKNNIDTISDKVLTFGIEGLGFYPAFNLPNSVYNELNSSGKLQNIKSGKVQKSISDFYSSLAFANSQLNYFRNSARSLEIDKHTDSYLYIYDSISPTRNKFKCDFERLLSNNNFKSRHIHGLRNQIVFSRYIKDLLSFAKTMCNNIATELKIECTSKHSSK